MIYGNPRGELTLIIGNMFSGKTSSLIRMINDQEEFGKKKVLVFKPDIDTRSGPSCIKNAHGAAKAAISAPVGKPWEIVEKIKWEEDKALGKFHIIAFDEVQFFPMYSDFFKVANSLLGRGYDIFAAGLAFDFRGEPFGSTPLLTGLSRQRCIWLHSLCTVCNEPAFLPQRFIDGKLAPYDSPQVLVGGAEKYEPRCYTHFVFPKKTKPPI